MTAIASVSTVGLVVGVLILAPHAAQAACTNLADTSSVACKNAAKCQVEIVKQATLYIRALQDEAVNAIDRSQAGALTDPPKTRCVGGTRHGKLCDFNNGSCKSNARKNGACNADSDCDGKIGSCDRTNGCNPSDPNDTYECQLDPGELYFSVSADKARAALKSAILKKCDNHGSGPIVLVADLGLDQIPACPGVGTAPTTDDAYDALIDCIAHSTDGDFASGKTFDWILRVFQRSVGTGAVPPKAKPGAADLDPRMLVQFNGSLMTQIGTVSPGLDTAAQSTAPGSLSPLGLASCTGNGRPSCLNNADCGRAADGTTAGVCVPHASATCPSGGGSCRALSGSQPLKANGADGNTLMLTPGCSGSVATCVRTVAKSAGNGTEASGGVDFSTGELFEDLPVGYEVYVTNVGADCATFDPCGVCSAGKCSAGPRSGKPCTAAEGSVTIECPPAGVPASTVFTPHLLSTEPKWMQANPGGLFCGFCDVTATQNGTCDGDTATCATGCAFSQSSGVNGDAECVAKLGAGHFCDFGFSKPGFHGDPNITFLSNDGVRSQYTPLVTGLFCDGRSGNTLIDNAAGLPGSVRTRLSYANGYVFSKDESAKKAGAMAKSRAIEDMLAALNRLRTEPTSAAAQLELRQALGSKSAHVAAKASQIIGEAEVATFTHDLFAAFERFLINPVKTDPNCLAKTAIADALYRLGADPGEVFLRGIRHVQMEPVWGGRNDTAGSLRGVCALGLVRINHRDALLEIGDLLADPEPRVRANAARTLAYSENPQAMPLLRLRALAGDDPEVVGECLTALIAIDPLPSLPFIERFLAKDDPPLQEAAALALGSSRLADAFPGLRSWWESTVQVDLRKTALLAIAMLKHDAPIDFLLSLIRDGKAMDGRDAIAALAIYKHDEVLVARVREAAAKHGDVDLSAAVKRAFETSGET